MKTGGKSFRKDGSARTRIQPLWFLAPAAAGAGALASGLAMPAAASAYATAPCHGTTAAGIGSSLQKVAQEGTDLSGNTTGWLHSFSALNNSVCSGSVFDAEPTYSAAGSGAGLAALCSDGVHLNTAFDFGAADDPPTPSQLSAMNSCTGAVAPPLAMHTIPVAQAGIAMVVHLPAGCTINSKDNASTKDRFAILNANLEKVFLNDGSVTWSTLLPNSSGCSGPVIRTVRYDQSGTTFQTENYLRQIGDAATWQAAASSPQQYQNWPNNGSNIVYGGTTAENPAGSCPLSGPGSTPADPSNSGETQPANRSLCNGASHVAQAVLDTPGSMGYVDMSTAIAKGFQYGGTKGTPTSFWIPVQNNGTGTKGTQTYADPNVNSNGYQNGQTTGGANCASSAYTPPTGADPTLASWSTVFGSDPSTADYPLCTLTYEQVWDDAAKAYGNTPAVDARQRSVKDYITYLTDTGTNDGQSILRSLNYDTLPSNVLSVAQAGAASVHFP